MRFYSKKDLCNLIRVARATIDRWTNDPEYERVRFPKPFRIQGCSRVFWNAELVDEWMRQRVEAQQDIPA